MKLNSLVKIYLGLFFVISAISALTNCFFWSESCQKISIPDFLKYLIFFFPILLVVKGLWLIFLSFNLQIAFDEQYVQDTTEDYSFSMWILFFGGNLSDKCEHIRDKYLTIIFELLLLIPITLYLMKIYSMLFSSN